MVRKGPASPTGGQLVTRLGLILLAAIAGALIGWHHPNMDLWPFGSAEAPQHSSVPIDSQQASAESEASFLALVHAELDDPGATSQATGTGAEASLLAQGYRACSLVADGLSVADLEALADPGAGLLATWQAQAVAYAAGAYLCPDASPTN